MSYLPNHRGILFLLIIDMMGLNKVVGIFIRQCNGFPPKTCGNDMCLVGGDFLM